MYIYDTCSDIWHVFSNTFPAILEHVTGVITNNCS